MYAPTREDATMTKEVFKVVAKALAASKPVKPCTKGTPYAVSYQYKRTQWLVTVGKIADDLQREYPNFNRDIFLTECGAGKP